MRQRIEETGRLAGAYLISTDYDAAELCPVQRRWSFLCQRDRF